MCYDMKKCNDIEKKQVDNIGQITQAINTYDINELVTFKEYRDTEDEFRIYLSKCLQIAGRFSFYNVTCIKTL